MPVSLLNHKSGEITPLLLNAFTAPAQRGMIEFQLRAAQKQAVAFKGLLISGNGQREMESQKIGLGSLRRQLTVHGGLQQLDG